MDNSQILATEDGLSTDRSTTLYAYAGDERNILRAWENFLAGVAITGPPVRVVVGSSWQRSFQCGVNAHDSRTPIVIDGGALFRLRERNRLLTDAAARTMAENAELLKGTRSMLILTDPNGVVLEVSGDPYTIDSGQDVNLVNGGNWNEGVIGTNAIGTAIAIDQAVQVHAAEHFCEGVKKWTCAAAPIHDPRNQTLLGVLDISGPDMSFCQHNLALALAAARQIETALSGKLFTERTRLLEACVGIRQTGKEGLVVLDQTGHVVFTNDKIVEQVSRGVISSALSVGTCIAEAGSSPSVEELAKRLPPDIKTEWLHPVKAGDNTLGSLLVIPSQSASGKSTQLPQRTDGQNRFRDIVGKSGAIKAAIERAVRIGGSSVPVLIEGETGVGKEMFARAIQSTGPISDDPYVVYNCGTASHELIGSELFGYVKGAFTGASNEGRVGRFEQADGGTLCLDEIGEMPLDLQPYLLRVLDEGIVYRLGENEPRNVNVRLLAMTNRNLLEEVEAGRFRRDLYHRISVTTILIPPLREREDDVDELISHFNTELSEYYKIEPRQFGKDVLARMRAYSWPGNVRELRNVVESLLLMGGDVSVALNELPVDIVDQFSRADTKGAPSLKGLEATERNTIDATIRAYHGNLSRAAKELGISRSTLYRKLEHYDHAH